MARNPSVGPLASAAEKPPSNVPTSQFVTHRPPPPKYAFELLVYTRQKSQVFPLDAGSVVAIGRGSDNSIHVDDPSASRQHARLHVGEEVQVEDLGSSNGTFLVKVAAPQEPHDEPPSRLTPFELTALAPGDVVRIGAVIVVLQIKGRSSSPTPLGEPGAGPFVLVDPEMRRVHELATRAAASEISVLILGETGSGKEVMAETVHRRSPRAGGPFLRLNCAALPESLLEGELFGHERGAYTGAHSAKAGLIESTDGGTVFLDEIGELPLGTQAKLLRVLEERTVMRLGSTRSKQVDVRFVTATHRDLVREVRAGRFRGDLYYRISGLVVRIPPLRQRKIEIGPLAHHFLRQFCARGGKPAPRLMGDAIDLLVTYDWPGNVRELRNVIERAALLASNGEITAEEVMLEPQSTSESKIPLDDADDFEAVTSVIANPLKLGGAENERDRVMRALESCGGNQTRAAKMLGVSRRTLINRLEQFNLPRPRRSPR